METTKENATAPALEPHVAEIVSSYLTRNQIAPSDLPALISSVYEALQALGKAPEAEPAKPAVPIRQSVTQDYVACLECGWRGSTLGRHLSTRHGLSRNEYRARWNLPYEHPLTAPAYSMRRAEMAKEIGLGGEEIIEIADDLKGDYRQGRDGKAVHNKESVLRSKLRIEARQWAMARLDPRLWGDRQQIDFKADWMQLSEEERVRKAMNLLGMVREVVEREKQMKLRGPRVITYDPQDGDELAEQELRERREREMAEEQEAGGIGRDSAGNPRPRWR